MGVYDIIPVPLSTQLLFGMCEKTENLSVKKSDEYEADEYEINVNKDGIAVTAGSERAVFYARQTLRQLVTGNSCRCCTIHDKPKYSYRSFMIDSARHMQSIDEIKKYIDAAAFLKFNNFHWHLTDDQGWRFECESYPRLNEIGSYRKSSDFGKEHTGEVYGGYYTKAQMKEIVEYCHERFITVVPEFDMPGHSSAAIASYPELSCFGEQIDVITKQGIYKNILCCGKESTFDFIFRLLDEVMEVFPDEYIHIGGDEAPKNRWDNCPECQRKLKELCLSDTEQLQGWFTNRIAEYLKSHGRKVIVWNESLKSGMLDENAVVQNWMDKESLCPEWVNHGGKMIASDYYHYYLDYPYGMTPLDKTFSFNPTVKGIGTFYADNVIGVEAPIWTEYVDNFEHMCYMCFPRLAAVAQTGWSGWGHSVTEFKSSLQELCPILEGMGINCAKPSQWNPNPIESARQVVKFFSGTVDKDTVMSFIKPKKDN